MINYNLQLLRFIAATLVFFFHAEENFLLLHEKLPLNGWFLNGFRGVDVFFLLSGFLLSNTISKDITFFSYLKNRIIRIYPTYWIALILGVLSLYIVDQNHPYLNLSNIVKNILLEPSHESFLGVTWTLTFEVYFYLLLSVSIVFKPSKRVWISILFLTIIWIGSGFLPQKFYWFNFMSSNYHFMFILGMLVKKFVELIELPNILKKNFYLLLPSLFLALYLLMFIDDFSRIERGFLSMFILLNIILLPKISNEKINLFFNHLGNASYIFYLIHLPVLRFYIKNSQDNKFELINLFLIFSILYFGCILFYYYVELRIIRFFRK
jgi:exopolysaccharide production protein ExoZ